MKSDELNPRIKIRAPLRCDGIGRLDCAEDTESGARLAVRWLPLEANGDAAVKACGKLPEHPTLPRIRQTGQMDGKAFVAMDFPDGKLLAAEMDAPVNGELLLEIGAQISDALATIHSQNVFHGELSTESVLLAKGKAYLWDMPLVIANRFTDRRGEERLMHQLVRTAPFLPPERARGGAPSAESDVYGLAAVICLAAGAPPPPLGTTLALVHSISNLTWAPTVPAVFHEPFHSLLSRMLETEPALRPTAREVADLLGKPAAAIPTIPEMPAIVLPKGFTLPKSPLEPLPVLKPAAAKASPFSAAPGALEPMLPSRAVADAAVKAAAANHKPLEVTVPTQVEPTVKVAVPPSVLDAMSQPTTVDAAIKAAVAAALPPLPATRTLEFGTASPKPPSTKTPVTAATMAQVNAAIAAATVAEPPPPAAVIPTPPPIPRKSNRELPAQQPTPVAPAPTTPAPVVAPPPAPEPVVAEAAASPGVSLSDNVAVSSDLAAAGASSLSPEESDALDMLPRSKPTWLVAAAVLALVTTVLAVGARALVTHSAAKPAVVSRPLPKPAPSVATPVADEVDLDDEDLAPLPVPKAKYRPTRRAAPRDQKPAPAAAPAEAPSAADDFSFLDTGYDAPKEELKRPQF